MLFDPYCLICCKQGSYLCSKCKRDLEPHRECCRMCKKLYDWFATCRQCRQRFGAIRGVIVGFTYNMTIKKLLWTLKFKRSYDLTEFLADRLIIHLRSHELFGNIDFKNVAISFVPMHRFKKRFIRGFNQSELLAQRLAKKLGAICISTCTKPQRTRSQKRLNKAQRAINLKGSFQVVRPLCLEQKTHLIIVDDVLTTGATLKEQAKLIKLASPDLEIRGITLARNS